MSDGEFKFIPLTKREIGDCRTVANALGVYRLVKGPVTGFIESGWNELSTKCGNFCSQSAEFVGRIKQRGFKHAKSAMRNSTVFLWDGDFLASNGILDLNTDVFEFFDSFQSRSAFFVKCPRYHIKETF